MGKFIDVEATAKKIYKKYGADPGYYVDNDNKLRKWARIDSIILEMIFDNKRMVYADVEKTIRWIPCSEGLPNTYVEVLICTKEKRIYIVDRDEYGLWSGDDGIFFEDFEIAAWMPLPEPYKGETDD